MKIHMILLAAGNSRRFGGNKLLSLWNGKPMYRYITDQIDGLEQSYIGKKVIVSQYDEILSERAHHSYTCIKNENPENGISHSIQLGLHAIAEDVDDSDAICFFVCDQPNFKRKTMDEFFQKYIYSNKKIGCVGTEHRLGNPVIFHAKYIAELMKLTGDVGGKSIVKKHMDDTFVFQVAEHELEDIDYRKKTLVVIRGGGDLASGVIHRLYREGYRVLVLEVENPACIRRQVSFAEAIYTKICEVEGIKAMKVEALAEVGHCWEKGMIPVLIDKKGKAIHQLHPEIVVDAILAKKNLGTNKEMAPLTIALGPGFTASEDVDFVIETMRGETLGKVYTEGTAIPNTGIPGEIAGFSKERVIHSPADGVFHAIRCIGDCVKKGEVLALVGSEPVYATLDGILRGQIREGFPVKKGLKIMDIDPRISELYHCFHISDKANKIAESVYEVIQEWEKEQENEFL